MIFLFSVLERTGIGNVLFERIKLCYNICTARLIPNRQRYAPVAYCVQSYLACTSNNHVLEKLGIQTLQVYRWYSVRYTLTRLSAFVTTKTCFGSAQANQD